jgi:hypothetical protein
VDPLKAKDSIIIALEQLKLSGQYPFLLCEAVAPLCRSPQGQGQPRHWAGEKAGFCFWRLKFGSYGNIYKKKLAGPQHCFEK